MTKIAFLGLGAMGSRMALNLVKAGFEVTVWNRDMAKAEALRQAGAQVASTPRAASAHADIVVSMVTDDQAARAVWLDPDHGAIRALRPKAVALECSTVSPGWIAELGAAVTSEGSALLDAPVAGSRPQAEAGQLIFMVGGEAEALETVRPILAPLSARVLHVGELGQGAILKLAVNTFFAAQLESLAELLGFLARNGFGRTDAAELLSGFPIVAPPIAGAARMMAAGQTTPLFTIDLIEKDLGYMLAAAQASSADLPGATAVRAAFRRAQSEGLGQANVSGLSSLFV
jgi:3-hydroxyisobutyrate dehydrogenase-like beta-hydroxyacid dehydrogenase